MINTQEGQKIGRIYIPLYYSEGRVGAIVSYLTIVPISIEKIDYNWEIIGVSEYFDPLGDMESVPTYDLHINWYDENTIRDIKLKRTF